MFFSMDCRGSFTRLPSTIRKGYCTKSFLTLPRARPRSPSMEINGGEYYFYFACSGHWPLGDRTPPTGVTFGRSEILTPAVFLTLQKQHVIDVGISKWASTVFLLESKPRTIMNKRCFPCKWTGEVHSHCMSCNSRSQQRFFHPPNLHWFMFILCYLFFTILSFRRM